MSSSAAAVQGGYCSNTVYRCSCLTLVSLIFSSQMRGQVWWCSAKRHWACTACLWEVSLCLYVLFIFCIVHQTRFKTSVYGLIPNLKSEKSLGQFEHEILTRSCHSRLHVCINQKLCKVLNFLQIWSSNFNVKTLLAILYCILFWVQSTLSLDYLCLVLLYCLLDLSFCQVNI